MERFAKDCVGVFSEISRYATNKVGTAPTPFLDESKDPLVVIEEPAKKGTNGQNAAPKGVVPPQGGQTLDKERELVSCPKSLPSA